MARRWPFLLPIAVILVLVGVFGKRLMDVEGGDDPHRLPSILLDRPMPQFSLAPLPGRDAHTDNFTNADLAGEVSLINVWGSWCVACLQEHPMLMDIAKQGDVAIHGIDWRDTPQAGLAWLNKHGDPYARIGQDPDSHTAIDLGVTGAPETFIVDQDGVIRYKQIGPITPEIWRTTMLPLIEHLRKGSPKP